MFFSENSIYLILNMRIIFMIGIYPKFWQPFMKWQDIGNPVKQGKEIQYPSKYSSTPVSKQ